MLILLPPSEGKTEPRTGRPVDLSRLSLPGLNPVRERALAALVDLCRPGREPEASASLALSSGQRGEVVRNAALLTAPAAPAGTVYSGVLYEALDLGSMSAGARRLALRSILVFSGLWGAIRLGDRIPAYRCPVGARVPGLGSLPALWRGSLEAELVAAAGSGVVLDLRSSAYGAMWTPGSAPTLAARTVSVQVVHERRVGPTTVRSVLSHFNKATKGRLVRDLLTARADGAPAPRTAGALAALLRDTGYVVEERGAPTRLDVVVAAR